MNEPTVFAPERAGVYRAPTRLQVVRDSVIAAGGSWFDIDLAPVRTKAQLLGAFAAAGDFPPTFGCNWDALADVLQDLSWRRATGYVLHLRQSAPAVFALGADWQTLLEVLAESAMYWKDRGKPFIALVDHASELPPWT